jgi:hypothetical protein
VSSIMITMPPQHGREEEEGRRDKRKEEGQRNLGKHQLTGVNDNVQPSKHTRHFLSVHFVNSSLLSVGVPWT